MKYRPVSPFVHGIIDYVFSFALLSVPHIIKLNKKARLLYALNGVSVLSYSAFTKYPVAVKQIIPLHLHKKLDAESLIVLSVTTLHKKIRKDKRAIVFSVAMVATGLLTVMLTDWNTSSHASI
jgi:hypothetical protein